jgi:hypothetical protein
MTKFPLLESLRAERERNEAEITAPVRRERDEWASRYQRKADALRALERLIGTEIARHVVEQIAHDLSEVVRRTVYEAVAKARPNRRSEIVTLHLPAATLSFMDPRSLERQILDQYVSESIPAAMVSADVELRQMITVLDVRVPQLGIRMAMADRH